MDENSLEPSRNGARSICTGEVMAASEVEDWFVRNVLPLEPLLMHFLRHNWRDQSDIEDLRQEVYVRVCEAAQRKAVESPKAFVLATARNLIVDRVRKGNVVPIDAVSDLEVLDVAIDAPGPDQSVMARQELERLQAALDQLPTRAKQVVVLRRIDNCSGREIATRMGISEATVWEYLADGIRALANALYSEDAPKRGGRP